MTLNAPNYPFTFVPERNQFGLVFDAPEGSIKKMWPTDASTRFSPQDRSWQSSAEGALTQNTDMWEYLKKIKEKLFDSPFRNNEVIADYGPNNLKGVRISEHASEEDKRPFLDFAERYDLPIYSWDATQYTKGQQANMLDDILATKQLGNWFTSPRESGSIAVTPKNW